MDSLIASIERLIEYWKYEQNPISKAEFYNDLREIRKIAEENILRHKQECKGDLESIRDILPRVMDKLISEEIQGELK